MKRRRRRGEKLSGQRRWKERMERGSSLSESGSAPPSQTGRRWAEGGEEERSEGRRREPVALMRRCYIPQRLTCEPQEKTFVPAGW